MKKLLYPALLALLCFLPARDSQAQFVVNDPIHMGVHITEFARKLREWSDTFQNYQVVLDAKRIADQAKTIQGTISNISGQVRDLTDQGLSLQRQIQADLARVQGVVNLRISSPVELYARAMAISQTGGINAYMPALSQAARLRSALTSANQSDIASVYQIFNRFDVTRPGNPLSSANYEATKQEGAVSQFALEAMNHKKKVETAFNLQKVADEMTAQSTELLATLKNDGRYKMTDAERLATISTCNDNMVKAIQLRKQADEILTESAKAGEMTKIVESSYQDMLSQKAMIAMDAARADH
jgi:hypothetical protein